MRAHLPPFLLCGLLVVQAACPACPPGGSDASVPEPPAGDPDGSVGEVDGGVRPDASVHPGDGGAPDAADPRADAGTTTSDAGRPSQCEATSGCAVAGSADGYQCVDGACVECARGAEDCQCRLNGRCAEGLRCTGGVCEACISGVEGCPCGVGSRCDPGLMCSSTGACVLDPCVPGQLDCPCEVGGACAGAPEAYCDSSQVCRACSEDIAGCPCGAGGVCGGDKLCVSGVCAECPDTDRPIGCGCSPDAPCATGVVCDEGMCRAPLRCDDMCLPHQSCDTSLPGDPYCVPESCDDGYAWNGEGCVAYIPPSCDGRAGTLDIRPECDTQEKVCVESAGEARCVATCETLAATCEAQHRDCDAGSVLDDAVCGACRPGYRLESAQCVLAPQANCVPGAPDSILAECDARLRACVPGGSSGATCGDCREGTTPDDEGVRCAPVESCAGEVCGDGEICVYPQTGGTPRCEVPQCPGDQAFDSSTSQCQTCNLDCGDRPLWPYTIDGVCACRDDVYCDFVHNGSGDRCRTSGCAEGEAETPGGECVRCPIVCGDTAGESPRLWPWTTLDGSCICETEPGYYVPLGGAATPLTCDRDQDGWLNRTAGATAPIDEPATKANFRCALNRVDRLVLRNEYGQDRYVSLCSDNTLHDWAPGDSPPCGGDPVILPLIEPDVLDDDVRVQLDETQFPPYRGGRKMLASELNPLTKLCSGLTADYNLDGREDVREDQPLKYDRVPGLRFASREDFVFQSFAYFAELHRSYYEPSLSSAGLPGRYVIQERSRCEEDFPLTYSAGGDYWRECSRRRRRDFALGSGSLVGFDFASWTCGATTGACAELTPPLRQGEWDQDNDRIPDHGLCNAQAPLRDGTWRGMSHHSQFQCVVLRDVVQGAWELDRDELRESEGTTRFEFNDCTAEGSNPEGPLQPQSPAISCVARPRSATQDEDVGFVSVRYVADGATSTVWPQYQRGCISEAVSEGDPDGWRELCPGGDTNPWTVMHSANPADFGRLTCGCDRFHGGEACEVACLDQGVPAGSTMPPSTGVHAGGPGLGYDGETQAAYGCSPVDGYCQLHPAVPDEDFAGGGRGTWMCGDFAQTLTVGSAGGGPALTGSGMIAGSERQLRLVGSVRLVPVERQPLEQVGCDPATTNCWSAW